MLQLVSDITDEDRGIFLPDLNGQSVDALEDDNCLIFMMDIPVFVCMNGICQLTVLSNLPWSEPTEASVTG